MRNNVRIALCTLLFLSFFLSPSLLVRFEDKVSFGCLEMLLWGTIFIFLWSIILWFRLNRGLESEYSNQIGLFFSDNVVHKVKTLREMFFHFYNMDRWKKKTTKKSVFNYKSVESNQKASQIQAKPVQLQETPIISLQALQWTKTNNRVILQSVLLKRRKSWFSFFFSFNFWESLFA